MEFYDFLARMKANHVQNVNNEQEKYTEKCQNSTNKANSHWDAMRLASIELLVKCGWKACIQTKRQKEVALFRLTSKTNNPIYENHASKWRNEAIHECGHIQWDRDKLWFEFSVADGFLTIFINIYTLTDLVSILL